MSNFHRIGDKLINLNQVQSFTCDDFQCTLIGIARDQNDCTRNPRIMFYKDENNGYDDALRLYQILDSPNKLPPDGYSDEVN